MATLAAPTDCCRSTKAPLSRSSSEVAVRDTLNLLNVTLGEQANLSCQSPTTPVNSPVSGSQLQTALTFSPAGNFVNDVLPGALLSHDANAIEPLRVPRASRGGECDSDASPQPSGSGSGTVGTAGTSSLKLPASPSPPSSPTISLSQDPQNGAADGGTQAPGRSFFFPDLSKELSVSDSPFAASDAFLCELPTSEGSMFEVQTEVQPLRVGSGLFSFRSLDRHTGAAAADAGAAPIMTRQRSKPDRDESRHGSLLANCAIFRTHEDRSPASIDDGASTPLASSGELNKHSVLNSSPFSCLGASNPPGPAPIQPSFGGPHTAPTRNDGVARQRSQSDQGLPRPALLADITPFANPHVVPSAMAGSHATNSSNLCMLPHATGSLPGPTRTSATLISPSCSHDTQTPALLDSRGPPTRGFLPVGSTSLVQLQQQISLGASVSAPNAVLGPYPANSCPEPVAVPSGSCVLDPQGQRSADATVMRDTEIPAAVGPPPVACRIGRRTPHCAQGDDTTRAYSREKKLLDRGARVHTPFGGRLRVAGTLPDASDCHLDVVETHVRDVTPSFTDASLTPEHRDEAAAAHVADACLRVSDALTAPLDTYAVSFVGSLRSAIEEVAQLNAVREDSINADGERLGGTRGVVFVSSWEQHAVPKLWAKQGLEVVVIPQDSEGRLDVVYLARQLTKHASAPSIIGFFAAGSAVTGVASGDLHTIAALLHRVEGLAVFDCSTAAAACGMQCVVPGALQEGALDAVYVASACKPGGAGAAGVLVYRRDLRTSLDPGPRARNVTAAACIRAGLALGMHADAENRAMEARYAQRALATWRKVPNLSLVGGTCPAARDGDRLGVLSFNILARNPGHRVGASLWLHPDFIVAVLYDIFGIRARAGRLRSGSYNEPALSQLAATAGKLMLAAADSPIERRTEGRALRRGSSRRDVAFDGMRPGWVTLRFSHVMTDDMAAYVVEAVAALAHGAYRMLPHYRLDLATGEFLHRQNTQLAQHSAPCQSGESLDLGSAPTVSLSPPPLASPRASPRSSRELASSRKSVASVARNGAATPVSPRGVVRHSTGTNGVDLAPGAGPSQGPTGASIPRHHSLDVSLDATSTSARQRADAQAHVRRSGSKPEKAKKTLLRGFVNMFSSPRTLPSTSRQVHNASLVESGGKRGPNSRPSKSGRSNASHSAEPEKQAAAKHAFRTRFGLLDEDAPSAAARSPSELQLCTQLRVQLEQGVRLMEDAAHDSAALLAAANELTRFTDRSVFLLPHQVAESLMLGKELRWR